MGMCASCEAGVPATAKVILYDGQLREYSRPAKAAQVLDNEGSAWFLCDADEMDFDGFVSALAPDYDLIPGQLYFVLPVSMLWKPLKAQQMATLAAKANAALVEAAPSSKSRLRRRNTLIFAEPPLVPAAARPAKRFGKGRRDFAMSLNAIPE